MDPVTLQTIEVGDVHVRRADGILRKLRHLLSLPEDEARAYAKKVERRLGHGATLETEACTLTVPVALLFTNASTGGAAQVLRVSFRSGAATAADKHGASRRRPRSADSSSSRSGDTDARGPSASDDKGDEAAAPPSKKGRLATLPERARNAFLGKSVVDAFVCALGDHLSEANALLARALDEANLASKRRKPPRQVAAPDAPDNVGRKALHAVAAQALGAAWTLHRGSLKELSAEARAEALEKLVRDLAATPVRVLSLPAVSGIYSTVVGRAPPTQLPVSPCSACRQLGCAACRGKKAAVPPQAAGRVAAPPFMTDEDEDAD